jgi:molecular chaperone GrpE
MADETTHSEAPAAEEEFSAAAPPHPGAAGTGETSFGDAEAPGASELAAVQSDLEELTRQRDDYLALAHRSQA